MIDSAPSRTLFHHRSIDASGYRRDDGRWEIEAHMVDTKTHPISNPVHGELASGVPYQRFAIRLVIDSAMVIEAVDARIETAPSGECRQIESVYGRLVGTRIAPGAMRETRALLAGSAACTNLTELLGIAMTAAVQTVGGAELNGPGGEALALARLAGTCHAWRADGELVRSLQQRPPAKPI